MLLSNHRDRSEYDFSVLGADLTEMNEIKDLGVVFKSDLSFTKHIDGIVAKAKQRLYLLKRFSCQATI